MQVSVIIASYNRGSLILDTLASLNAQTLTDAEMEVLIVGRRIFRWLWRTGR